MVIDLFIDFKKYLCQDDKNAEEDDDAALSLVDDLFVTNFANFNEFFSNCKS